MAALGVAFFPTTGPAYAAVETQRLKLLPSDPALLVTLIEQPEQFEALAGAACVRVRQKRSERNGDCKSSAVAVLTVP